MGYKHIVESIRSHLPQARILAIEPSPYDNVTRPPRFPVGGDLQYNEVMRSFGKWIANYASQSGLDIADLNSGMVQTLRQAQELDPATAKQIIADHIHPLLRGPYHSCRRAAEGMAGKTVVSAVTLEVSHGALKVNATLFAAVSHSSFAPVISWTELDDALPLPFKQWDGMWGGGPVDLVVRSSDVTNALNQQLLHSGKGLQSGTYSLKIDGTSVGGIQ